MKPRFVDPFTPNRPIHDPERFFGRKDPVNEMIDSLFQIKNGNPKHSIVTGDRGVGKSSLLTQIHLTATGNNNLTDRLEIDRGVDKFDFITVWHDVDSTQSVFTLAQAILSKFESTFRKLLSGVNLEIDLAGFGKLGVQSQGKIVEMTILIDEFVSRIKKINAEAKKNNKDGVLIFIDELDRIQTSSMISSFFKLVTERMAREDLYNVGFICAGITGAIQKLEDEHKSIARTFRDIPLIRFNSDECLEILLDGFTKAKHQCNILDLSAKAYNVTLGLPEPLHILGSEMLSVNENGILSDNDYEEAIKKIITDVRKNTLETLLKKAGTGKYQKIIEAIASHKNQVVPLDYIATCINQDQSQFSTNMGMLVEREILIKPQIGYYQFADPMLKEYVRLNGVLGFDE